MGQIACDDVLLERAQSAFEFGWARQTTVMLEPCLPEGFPLSRQRVWAYRILALAHIALDSPEKAEDAVSNLLEVDPGYRPDPEADNMKFTRMVEDSRPPWYAWLWKGNEWYKWAGRGALAVGIAAIPFAAGTGGRSSLPEPPPDPQ